MDKEKDKKKTLTISSNFKKKIDTNSLSKVEKRNSFSIPSDKKNSFKALKNSRKIGSTDQNFKASDVSQKIKIFPLKDGIELLSDLLKYSGRLEKGIMPPISKRLQPCAALMKNRSMPTHSAQMHI